ncbi:NB-ARC domain-containing protein [Micromonospora parathelypteridis]|uniref:NB-ARC domain-containing protein n=1 Tax=Micromonospora parathelypteridis TaxID=1839617 RepID=UPI001669ED90|nr:NB-ARC domain-containing protein [Micromonospora parathelypteridis]
MSLRWLIRRARRRLRRFRLLIAAAVTVLASVLGTVYDKIPADLQLAALLVIGAFGAAAVILVESPEASYEQSLVDPPSARKSKRAKPARPRRDRTEPRFRLAQWLGWWRNQVVPTLPPRDELFRGRERELADLQGLHDVQRAARTGGVRSIFRRGGRRTADRRGAAGPVILLLHGMPGVGKTALADELARRLARRYPHGQLFVNLGTGGAARTPMEILKELLLALGWSDMPDTAVGRAMVFRSLTAKKRILFILDAARNADQVRHVLPSDSAAAVIITCRRGMTWSDPLAEPSYALGLPDDDEALAIFRAVSRTAESVRPECAAEIVSLCGRLPLAVRAAAERVSNDGADICQIAGLLREPRSRLGWLDRPGRSLRAHLQTEYGRLLPKEQQALAMLALIPSPTFVPWVLGPLMNLPPAEVEALVDRLSAAQLLEDLGMDEVSEVARYRLHPLVRLFASAQAARIPAHEREWALDQLTAAYVQVVSAVLAVLHDDFVYAGPMDWLAPDSKYPQRIADHPEAWVRAEYPNLLRVLDDTAALPDTGFGTQLRWRVGAWLDGCVAEGVSSAATLAAYAQAARAAERDGNVLAQVDVLLAKGTFLVAVERYRDAEQDLDRAIALSHRLLGDRSAAREEAERRIAIALRKMGEGFLQAAAYQRAVEKLEDALARAETIGDGPAQRLIRILFAEAHHVDTAEAVYDELLDPGLSDATRYRIYLSLAEAGRRRGDWQSASDYLGQAARLVDGDLRRVANVRYRTARLALDQYEDGTGGGDGRDPELAATAVRRAAHALLTFRQMGNPLGTVRTQCLLARAILAMGRPVEADHVAHAAEGELAAVQGSGEKPEVLAPLTARLTRVKGEIRLRAGDRTGGRQLLMDAAMTFGELKDWAGLRAVLGLLEEVAPAGAEAPGVGLPVVVPVDGWPGRGPMPMGGGPVNLSPAVTDRLAARLSSQVVDRVQDELRLTLTPAEPVAFRGALGAGLTGAETAHDEELPPTWRIPVGELCHLTVLVATGQPAFADEPGRRPALAGPRVWRPLAVSTGVRADDVDLTLLVDAPFVDVSDPELRTTCRVEGGLARLDSTLRIGEPGANELRITLLSSGRLVQSLPIRLLAVTGEESVGGPATVPLA